MRALAAAILGVVALAASLAPASALAHGDEPEEVTAAGDGAGMSKREAEEAELEELARQPARILAQQALATVEVRGDDVEAAERLEAALASEDRDDIDLQLVADAGEALERGDSELAAALLDEALSRPLGAGEGKSLHAAGREFRPAIGSQEIVGIVAGAALLMLGALLLLPRRSAQASG